MSFLLQNLFAVAAVLSSLLVITSKNPVISVLFLISVFVNSAIYLIYLGVGFVGISYIIIYVGAIAILFLFILMMINIKLTDILELGKDYTKNLPLALVIGALFIYAIYTIIPFSFQDISFVSIATTGLNNTNSLLLDSTVNSVSLNEIIHQSKDILIFENEATMILDQLSVINSTSPDAILYDIPQIESLGLNLYTQSSLLLIFTSLILLLSMLAPILLSSLYRSRN